MRVRVGTTPRPTLSCSCARQLELKLLPTTQPIASPNRTVRTPTSPGVASQQVRKAAEDVGRAHGRKPQAEQNKCWTFAPKSLVTTRLKRDTALGSVELLGDASLEKQFTRLFNLVKRYDEPEELARLLRFPGEASGGGGGGDDDKASANAAAAAARAAAVSCHYTSPLLSSPLLSSPLLSSLPFPSRDAHPTTK